MEDLGTLDLSSPSIALHTHPHPKLKLLMEDFVLWTGVWRLLLYPPRIPYRYNLKYQSAKGGNNPGSECANF